MTVGLYQPSLRTLNHVLQTPNSAILQDPNFQLQPNPLFTPDVRNLKISRFRLDSVFGIEARREVAPRHAFLVTVNVWDSVKEGKDVVPQITGANVSTFENVPRTTRYNLSIVQLWLGWRYTLFSPSPSNQVYLDIGLIGGSFAQMTIDALLKVPELAGQGFPVASSMEASGWGLTTRWGVGAEYAVNQWFGFSFRAAYVYGRVRRMEVDRFFPSGFSTPPVPQEGTDLAERPEEGNVVKIAEVTSTGPIQEPRFNERELPLELDGIEFMVGIVLSF